MSHKLSLKFWTGLSLSLAATWIFGATASAADAPSSAPALPFVHPIYDSHMVLPRDVENPVWGWAQPGELVSVEVKDNFARTVQRKAVRAGADGRWEAAIGPFKASEQPISLVFTRAANPPVTLTDVLVGDVWPKYPGNLQSAHAGEKLPIAKVPAGVKFKPGDENVYCGKAQFYTLRYGNYLIGLNTTTDKTFELKPLTGIAEAKELVTGKTLKLAAPLEVAPRSTIVLWLGAK